MTMGPTECSVVIGAFNEKGIKRRSLQSPGTLFIDISGRAVMARNGVAVKCESRAVRIITVCLCRPGALVRRADIIDLLFGDCADGGPDRADVTISHSISAARIAGAALGIVITTAYGRGVSARLQGAA
jgi:DNA-binding response OmpR family regulator